MQRITEELDQKGRTYRKLMLRELKFPLKRYPKYVMILFLDIMRYRDDLIYGLGVLEEFIRAGVKLIPPLKGMYYSDKFSNFILWERYLKSVVHIPETLCTIELQMGLDFLKKHKEILFKPIAGSLGRGIEVVESETHLRKLHDNFHTLILQEVIQDRDYDIRTLMVGDDIVAQYARYNPTQLLKNIHRGAEAKSRDEMEEFDQQATYFFEKSAEISREVKKVAELDIIGIDTLPSKDGEIYLIEWNSVPGFRGAETATKKNIAKEIVEFSFKE